MNRIDIENNRAMLETIGLDDDMILGMNNDDIERYCTRENFVLMFDECDLLDEDLATFAMAIRGQRYLLQNMDVLR